MKTRCLSDVLLLGSSSFSSPRRTQQTAVMFTEVRASSAPAPAPAATATAATATAPSRRLTVRTVPLSTAAADAAATVVMSGNRQLVSTTSQQFAVRPRNSPPRRRRHGRCSDDDEVLHIAQEARRIDAIADRVAPVRTTQTAAHPAAAAASPPARRHR